VFEPVNTDVSLVIAVSAFDVREMAENGSAVMMRIFSFNIESFGKKCKAIYIQKLER